MDLGFIIEQLPYADHLTEEVQIAKGKAQDGNDLEGS